MDDENLKDAERDEELAARPDEGADEPNEAAAEEEEDFASLLESSFQPIKELARGEKVRGKIIGFNDEWIFLDLGTKGEGMIAANELSSAPNGRPPAVGEWLEAYFLGEEDGEMRLTTRVGGAEASRALLLDAYRAKIPVEGTVAREIKGGFEVQVGSARCFCPHSQIDLIRQEPASYVGQSLTFHITEFQEGGRNIIVSRRAFLEAERRKRLHELRATLEVGVTVGGTVRALEPFGAFIDLNGVDGLIPLSELAWGRTDDPREVLAAGQAVEVKVIDLDWDKNRITLSLKRMTPNPWSRVQELLAEEQVTTGRVVSLTSYGAFVEVLPGIEGLIHISRLTLGKRVQHPREVVNEGDTVTVRIEAIDAENRRLSLSLVAETEVQEPAAAVPAKPEVAVAVSNCVPAIVEAVKPFGVLARLPDGRVGLVPVAELLTPQQASLRRRYPLGQRLTVQVLEITEGGKRIRLSERAAREAGEASYASDYLAQRESAARSGFGSLGDLLKKPKK